MSKTDYVDEDLCWAAFRCFDRNGDGVISRQEITECLTMGDLEDEAERDAFIEMVMLDVDEDGSGAIDFHEFLEVMADVRASSSQKSHSFSQILGNGS